MKHAVAVVMCAYLSERRDQLHAAIRSLESQTLRPDAVVVVVDGNEPLASQLDAELTDCTVIGLPRRSGLAHARNVGVTACDSDIVLFLDDDAVAEPEWVEYLATLIATPGVLGASGFSEPAWAGSAPRWLPDEFLWTVGASYRGQPTTRTNVRNVYGGCCGLRRSLFEDLGGYDPSLGRGPLSQGGGEEAELCLRALQRWPNGAFFYEPSARIRHNVPEDRLRLRYLLRRAYDEGRMKSAVAHLQPGALSPERAFSQQLPAALIRYAVAGIRGDRTGFQRALTLTALSTAVVCGLVSGSMRQAQTQRGS